jgi:hypothetical protein
MTSEDHSPSAVKESAAEPHFVTATGVGVWRVTSYGMSLSSVMSGVLL